MLLFSLSGLACDVFNRYALPGVYHYAAWQTSNLRRVKCANKIVVDFKLLTAALSNAMRLMDNNLFDKLIEDNRTPPIEALADIEVVPNIFAATMAANSSHRS